MLTPRLAADRRRFDLGWLDTRHTFSFGRYHDPAHMGFRALRVINEDIVAPSRGFGRHPHEHMEILSYVVAGELAHADSTGSQETIRPGQVQHMSAGSGLEHSEFNPSPTTPVHFLQIWLEPDVRDTPPGYRTLDIPAGARDNALALIAAPSTDRPGPHVLELNADARVYAGLLTPGARVTLELTPGRHAWVQLVRGDVLVNDTRLGAGDGCAVSDETALSIAASSDSEVLVFDLA